MTDYSTFSDIELSNRLKVLTRELKKAQSSRNSNPTEPDHFVKNAEIDAQMDEIRTQQTQLGEMLLDRDKERQKRAAERMEQQAITGAEKAEELLSKLPEFAHKVSVAFGMLGEGYAELLALSHAIRKTNMVLLGSNKRQCVPAAVWIEPNNLHKLLKEAFRASFGADAANVFLPQQSQGFDIKTAVEAIVQQCSGKEVAHEQTK